MLFAVLAWTYTVQSKWSKVWCPCVLYTWEHKPEADSVINHEFHKVKLPIDLYHVDFFT